MEVILLMSGFMIPTFMYAFLWHLVWFKSIYKKIGLYDREKPILPFGVVTTFIQGAIFATLFLHFDIDLPAIQKALFLALLLGLFEFCSSALAFAAKRKIERLDQWILIQFMLSITIFPIAGTIAVLGWSIYK